jgi:hypothetical protein
MVIFHNQAREDRVAGSADQLKRTVGIQHITDALIASGYTSLDEQAKALGVNRSTTWTIVKAKHKLGRLSAKTSGRILANPELPARVRAVMQQYLAERSATLGRASRTIRGRNLRHVTAKRGRHVILGDQ